MAAPNTCDNIRRRVHAHLPNTTREVQAPDQGMHFARTRKRC